MSNDRGAERVEIEAIRLSRGGCYGTCPIYDVTFRGDGSAKWIGEMFTDRLGLFTGSVPLDRFAKLARYIEDSGFFDWDARYEQPVTCNPEYRIEVVRNGVPKEVLQYATDQPPGFGRIAKRIDALANNVDWTLDSSVDPSSY